MMHRYKIEHMLYLAWEQSMRSDPDNNDLRSVNVPSRVSLITINLLKDVVKFLLLIDRSSAPA